MTLYILQRVGRRLARYLSEPDEESQNITTCSRKQLENSLKPGDVLLVDGSSRISAAIKYLTQSTWSHAAFYIGDSLDSFDSTDEPRVLIESDLIQGVHAVPLNNYCHMHVRICRPVGLSQEEINRIVNFLISRIGYKYDLKNLFDLARYFIQKPAVPRKRRRRLLAFGSGDPTRAICSSLIAEAFQSEQYPILPHIKINETSTKAMQETYKEILHIRHHSLFAPRDFDISPYFKIVKPSIEKEFDHHQLEWANN